MVISLKELYSFAISEGEGLGSVYEYYIKLSFLIRKFKNKNIRSMLIYGLPEKFGYSLDLLYFAKIKNIKEVYVVDDRVKRIKAYKKLLIFFNFPFVKNISVMSFNEGLKRKYDLIISSEVLQRLDGNDKIKYFNNLNFSMHSIIYVPNFNNKGHQMVSGLKSMSSDEFSDSFQIDYIDALLVSPGLKLKSNSKVKKIMPLQVIYLMVFLEFLMPQFVKKKLAHIIQAVK